MDYSPHREGGGTLHLPSPSHAHHIDAFAAADLRRSMSRSPSKPQRFSLYAQTPTKSPVSLSPLAVSRPFSPRPIHQNNMFSLPPSNMVETPTPPKKKFSLRRPLKSTRTPASTRSPMRRALSDASHHGNVTPSCSRPSSGGEENRSGTDSSDSSASKYESKPPTFRFDIHENPVKFDAPRHRQEAMTAADSGPVRSSPLKRGDGHMHLGQAKFTTPIKRRSLHGASIFADTDVFNQSSSPLNFDSFPTASENNNNDRQQPVERPLRHHFSAIEVPFNSFSSPAVKRTNSLRKSTRQTPHLSRGRAFVDSSHEAVSQSAAPMKARNRFSLDASLLSHSPFLSRLGGTASNPVYNQSQAARSTNSVHEQQHQPHPLSRSLVPSNSGSTLTEDTEANTSRAESTNTSTLMEKPPLPMPKNPVFSKSLPIGAFRPAINSGTNSTTDSFATPASFKSGQHPGGYMSTGLISKRNRNPDFHPYNDMDRYAMPDTPSKRASFPPVTATPFQKIAEPSAYTPFGEPGTPLISNTSRTPFDLFGKYTNGGIFGGGDLVRRSSFVSEDGDDRTKEQQDSQSSADELPPTPTKVNGSAGRIKQNSLRSSLFGRRASLGPDTFAPIPSTNSEDVAPPKIVRRVTPVHDMSDRSSPLTPQNSFTSPEAGKLSIAAFKSSTASTIPATPTAQRDHPFGNVPIIPQNDVDTSITSRFSSVTTLALGEFSMVYRVEKPTHLAYIGGQSSPSPGKAWVVKKAKKPYIGLRDRSRKLREVDVLRALRGQAHVLEFLDHWEADNHLYIQTEFCENGSLSKFLAETGNKARLDDFRIWKILLEMTLGVKAIHDSGFIHLDLKPANIFITFEGMLKIGDFGLATRWPASKDFDGEGDREYISPEVLSGRFDKPADVFAAGLITLEIAGNFFLPDNGDQWQRLRSGNLSDIPSLTWSTDSQLDRDENGDPIDAEEPSCQLLLSPRNTLHQHQHQHPHAHRLVGMDEPPPNFMVDSKDPHSLDSLVEWMLCPNPDERPTMDDVQRSAGLEWVARRRRAGATVYEGNWGPTDYVLGPRTHYGTANDADVEMADV